MTLKTRVIPMLLFNGTSLIKGESFKSWRRVGTPMQSVRVNNLRDVDELIFLDIAASPNGRRPDFNCIDELADHCFMPLTVGGGVRSVEDVRALLAVGADKVAINTAAYDVPELVRDASREFGSQCIVVSIDVTYRSNEPRVVVDCGTRITEIDPVAWAIECETRGAGEVLLTNADRDGTLRGMDLDLIQSVASAVNVPVIAAGGAASAADFIAAVRAGASAVAGGAIFQFTEQTPGDIKRSFSAAGIPARM